MDVSEAFDVAVDFTNPYVVVCMSSVVDPCASEDNLHIRVVWLFTILPLSISDKLSDDSVDNICPWVDFMPSRASVVCFPSSVLNRSTFWSDSISAAYIFKLSSNIFFGGTVSSSLPIDLSF